MSAAPPRIRLATLFDHGQAVLADRHGHRLHPHHRKAIHAILACRSGALGAFDWQCPDCDTHRTTPRSCGHRHCPACQNHSTTQWLERQRGKLLPVDYFMVTFTLPAELRPLALAQPAVVYAALLRAASDTLSGFAERKLHARIGQCAVLHTHNRRLDLHPHVHVVVPGGGIDEKRRCWRALRGRYLFNAFALARVFRAKLLHALTDAGLSLPIGLPNRWVVDCRNVGRGEPALEYLSRYLYRGVIREHDLIDHDPARGTVTFRYRDAQTRTDATRTLPIADFLWTVLQHVLPTGLRRVREYGFLHGKAKTRLTLVQLILHVQIAARPAVPRPALCCPCCQAPMRCVGMTSRRVRDG
ncbi:MAG: transposase [Pseudomonadota bacterium]